MQRNPYPPARALSPPFRGFLSPRGLGLALTRSTPCRFSRISRTSPASSGRSPCTPARRRNTSSPDRRLLPPASSRPPPSRRPGPSPCASPPLVTAACHADPVEAPPVIDVIQTRAPTLAAARRGDRIIPANLHQVLHGLPPHSFTSPRGIISASIAPHPRHGVTLMPL